MQREFTERGQSALDGLRVTNWIANWLRTHIAVRDMDLGRFLSRGSPECAARAAPPRIVLAPRRAALASPAMSSHPPVFTAETALSCLLPGLLAGGGPVPGLRHRLHGGPSPAGPGARCLAVVGFAPAAGRR